MKIQSISIVVPTNGCVNNCYPCVSHMHGNNYAALFDFIQIRKRIKFAVNNGVNTCILTGTGEALQNKSFLIKLFGVFEELNHPFPNVELQTTGVLLNKKDMVDEITYPNLDLLKKLQVDTISLSVFDLYDDSNNMALMRAKKFLHFGLNELTKLIKVNKFNLRLSLNLTKKDDTMPTDLILERCKELGANQITFRKLYHNSDDTPKQIG